MTRQTLTTVLLAIVASASIGFAFGRASDPAPASADLVRAAKAVTVKDSAVQRELYRMNLTLGTYPLAPGKGTLEQIRLILRQICLNTVGGYTTKCFP